MTLDRFMWLVFCVGVACIAIGITLMFVRGHR